MTGERDEPTAALAFIAELKRWRDVRGYSQSALAKQVGYAPSYVSKVENGQQRPSTEFAASADRVLNTGGAIRRVHHEYEQQRPDSTNGHRGVPVEAQDAASSLLVVHDDARLSSDGRMYRATQRRKLYNASDAPITRYLIRISVDRHPGNPERSNQLYRENPLTWEEIGLSAQCGDDPMTWKVQHDRDAFKELWLLFENEYGRFPLYPGESVWIEYSYTVSEDKWGTWFQRAVRLPTERLSVQLDFPAALDPAVWGMETTMTAEAFPLRTAIAQNEENGRRRFSWSTENPPLHARFRIEWKFRAHRDEEKPEVSPSPSEVMRSLGIVQEGDPILTQVARPFDLPTEAEDARRVIAELQSVAARVREVHNFSKGMGIAAPQIGIDRAAAIAWTPDGDVITLLNPEIIDESAATDEQYEGCLSFFDVRGAVRRPLEIHVKHENISGEENISAFKNGISRLIHHEIDHLFGILYKKIMATTSKPIPISEYRGTGRPWTVQ